MIISSYSDYKIALDIINNSDVIAYDIETDGLNVRSNSIIGFGAWGSCGAGFYLPIYVWNGSKLIPTAQYSFAVKLLTALKGKKIIPFNAFFDLEMTKNFLNVDLYGSLYLDVLLLKHTVDEERPFRLKDISTKVFGAESKIEQLEVKESIKKNGGKSNEFYKCDMPIMAKYCIKDCKLTYDLYLHYIKILKSEKLEDFFFKDEVMPLFKEVTVDMQRRGIPLDMKLIMSEEPKLRLLIDNLESIIMPKLDSFLSDFKEKQLNSLYPIKKTGKFAQGVCKVFNLNLPKTPKGLYSLAKKNLQELDQTNKAVSFLQNIENHQLSDQDILSVQKYLFNEDFSNSLFNLKSKDHLKNLFFNILKETPVSFTEYGKPSVDDKFLKSVEHKYEWVTELRKFNRLCKIHSAYFTRFLNESENGIFYPQFFQHRTISGRYGSDLQQLPRVVSEGEEPDEDIRFYNNLIREMFISGEGYKFIDSDYESLEPHVFAHVSGDEGLRDIFRKGHDFYSTIAIATEKLKNVSADKKADNYLGKVNKPLRQKSKAYCLGVPYGMGDYALGKTLNIEQEEAKILIEGYLSGFPKLAKWMKDSDDLCKLEGKVQSEAGRIRHMPYAKELYAKYGENLLNSLWIWKQYSPKADKYDDTRSFERYNEIRKLRRKLVNYLNNSKNFQIQSLSASIVNRASIAISRYLKDNNIDGYICGQIHDQIIVRVHNNYSDEVSKSVQEIMENIYKLSIKLKAPAEIGENFSDAH